MSAERVEVAIVGLGRWAKVLARAAAKSDRLKIIAAYSRSEQKRRPLTRWVSTVETDRPSRTAISAVDIP